MSTTNTPLLKQWFELVWNDGKDEYIDQLMDVQARIIDQKPKAEFAGPEHIREVSIALKSKFEKLYFEVGEVKEESDVQVANCHITAFYKGRPVDINGPARIRIREGKIVEAANDFDLLLYEEAKRLDTEPIS